MTDMTVGHELSRALVGFHAQELGGDLLARALAGAHHVVSPSGIVARCRRRDSFPGLPKIPVWVAVGPRRDGGGRRLRALPIGTGVDSVEEHAWLKAVVETLERYCLVWPGHRSRVLRASTEDVHEWAVSPDRFGIFSHDQYSATPTLSLPRPGDPIDWTWAWSLTNDRAVLVPAVLAFGAVSAAKPNDFTHALSSTGVATHVSLPAALLSGLEEVIERDAVMLAWLHRRRPSRVVVDDQVPSQLTTLVSDCFQLPGLRFVLLDLTADTGISTLACLALSDDPNLPAAVMGSASRLEPAEAATKALFEAAQILSSLAGLGCTSTSSLAENQVRTFEDHARYYAGTTAAARLSFLHSSAKEVPLSGLPRLSTGIATDDLRATLAKLAAVGLEALAVDLTTPDTAAAGFRTVKVLVPGAVDINADVRFPHLGSPRIAAVPEVLGWPSYPPGDLNLSPCPLP